MDLKEAIRKCNKSEEDEIIYEQISAGGIGSDLFLEAEQNNGTIRLQNLVNYVFTQQYGIKVVKLLGSQFEFVELIEQCSDFFKLRMSREDKTIGYLFGLMDDSKADFNIAEYSVNQTSLEQIFQSFAN